MPNFPYSSLLAELEEILVDDPKLNREDFLKRIYKSIVINGADRTASEQIYNLPLDFVLRVEKYFNDFW